MAFISGLIDRIRVLKVASGDSGSGTISEIETVLAASLRARFTTLESSLTPHPAGRGTKRIWKVLVETTTVFDDDSFVYKITGGQGVITPTDDGPKKFSVLRSDLKRDDIGLVHHVSLEVEEE